jgi:hypothetical protein
MRTSFRYFAGFFLGIAIVLLGLYALAYAVAGTQTEAGRWTAEILDKKRAVAMERPPKLLIVGGSNALFGFSAERIETKYGIPAVNFATHAGLGLRYILDSARPFVKPGTTIVLAIEYNLYGKPKRSQIEFLHLLGYDFEYFRNLPLRAQIDVLTGTEWLGWARIIKARLIGDARRSDSYQSETLNSYGDETGNRAENRNDYVVARLGAIPSGGNIDISPEAIALIKDFAEYAKERDARVVVTYPNVLRNTVNFAVNVPTFADLAGRLDKFGVPLIGTASANAFDLKVALDTVSHQTREGQIAATDRLVADLRAAGLY